MPRDRIGEIIGHRYRIIEQVGQGGHCLIYRAEDILEKRPVALKILHQSLVSKSEYGVRLAREFRAMMLLQGTASVAVEELRATPEGAMCLVMELLEGQDLDDWLAAQEGRGQRVSVAGLFALLDPIVETLTAAHGLGVVHRDIKPGNIFVLAGAHRDPVRLLDFGLCMLPTVGKPLTLDGTVLGSPSYIAPEVWSGKPRELDHRVDIYSLGALVYRLLTGRVPFAAPNLKEQLRRVTRAERPRVSDHRADLPPEIDPWIAQALAIERDERFANIRAMWAALRHVLTAHQN